MPIRWTISREERLVVATTEGVVTLKDVEAYLDALVVADAMPYAKLFDASDIEPQGSDHDVLMLGARMSAYASNLEPRGAVAIIAPDEEASDLAKRFINLAASKRPAKVFLAEDEARTWLAAQPEV